MPTVLRVTRARPFDAAKEAVGLDVDICVAPVAVVAILHLSSARCEEIDVIRAYRRPVVFCRKLVEGTDICHEVCVDEPKILSGVGSNCGAKDGEVDGEGDDNGGEGPIFLSGGVARLKLQRVAVEGQDATLRPIAVLRVEFVEVRCTELVGDNGRDNGRLDHREAG